MRKDGFFSFPGLIILDEMSHEKIINAIEKLFYMDFFKNFKGVTEKPRNNRFIDKWCENKSHFPDKESSYQIL